TVNALPTITASADQAVICEGSTTTLRATGGISYEWFIGETSVGTGADFPVSPLVETTYTVVGTNETGCQNTAKLIVKVDDSSNPGTLTGTATVCFGNNEGILKLSDYVSKIEIWENSIDNGSTWAEITGTE